MCPVHRWLNAVEALTFDRSTTLSKIQGWVEQSLNPTDTFLFFRKNLRSIATYPMQDFLGVDGSGLGTSKK